MFNKETNVDSNRYRIKINKSQLPCIKKRIRTMSFQGDNKHFRTALEKEYDKRIQFLHTIGIANKNIKKYNKRKTRISAFIPEEIQRKLEFDQKILQLPDPPHNTNQFLFNNMYSFSDPYFSQTSDLMDFFGESTQKDKFGSMIGLINQQMSKKLGNKRDKNDDKKGKKENKGKISNIQKQAELFKLVRTQSSSTQYTLSPSKISFVKYQINSNNTTSNIDKKENNLIKLIKGNENYDKVVTQLLKKIDEKDKKIQKLMKEIHPQ